MRCFHVINFKNDLCAAMAADSKTTRAPIKMTWTNRSK